MAALRGLTLAPFAVGAFLLKAFEKLPFRLSFSPALPLAEAGASSSTASASAAEDLAAADLASDSLPSDDLALAPSTWAAAAWAAAAGGCSVADALAVSFSPGSTPSALS